MPRLVYDPNKGLIEQTGDGIDFSEGDLVLSSLRYTPVQISGSFSLKDHHVVLCDAVSGSMTISLPDARVAESRTYLLKKIDATANWIHLQPTSAQLIDGDSVKSTNMQYAAIRILAARGNWYII